jgi:hypothetical protein
MYYRFLETFSRDPDDLDDLFDGLRTIAANNALQEYALKKKE